MHETGSACMCRSCFVELLFTKKRLLLCMSCHVMYLPAVPNHSLTNSRLTL